MAFSVCLPIVELPFGSDCRRWQHALLTDADSCRAREKVWVITGDKQETAINIAISCKLILHPEKLMICNADNVESASPAPGVGSAAAEVILRMLGGRRCHGRGIKG